MRLRILRLTTCNKWKGKGFLKLTIVFGVSRAECVARAPMCHARVCVSVLGARSNRNSPIGNRNTQEGPSEWPYGGLCP